MSNNNIQIYSIDEKQYIEENIQHGKKNIYKEDCINLISNIDNDFLEIYNRRKEIDGTGIFYSESKFVKLFDEAYKSYLLGFYQSTIALCSITAERICYDYLEYSKLCINNKLITKEAKKELYHLSYYRMVEFLFKEGLIDNKIRSVLLKINDTRNKYIHPTANDNPQKDSIEILNQLCKVIVDLLLLHDIKDHHTAYRSKVLRLSKKH